jgi:hypothetical protein
VYDACRSGADTLKSGGKPPYQWVTLIPQGSGFDMGRSIFGSIHGDIASIFDGAYKAPIKVFTSTCKSMVILIETTFPWSPTHGWI